MSAVTIRVRRFFPSASTADRIPPSRSRIEERAAIARIADPAKPARLIWIKWGAARERYQIYGRICTA
jgi:hypothetical protein